MKKYLLICLFLFSFLPAGTKTDPLQTLADLGLQAMDEKNYSLADSLLRKGLRESLVRNNKKMQSLFLGNLGYVADKQGKPARALYFYRKSLALAEQRGDSLCMATNSLNIGIALKSKGQHVDGLKYLLQASDLFEKLIEEGKDQKEKTENMKDLASCFSTIGYIHNELQDTTISIGYYRKSLHMRELVKHPEGIAGALNNIGEFYFRLNSYDSALYYLNKALAIKQDLKDNPLIASTLVNMGNVYDSLRQKEKAASLFLEAYRLQKSKQDSNGIAHSCTRIAAYFLERGRFDSAFYFISVGMPVAQELDALSDLCEYYNIRRQLYRKIKQFERALWDNEKYILLKDQLQGKSATLALMNTILRFERDKTNQEIAIAAEKEIHEREQKQLYRGGAMILMGVLSLTIYLFISNRKKKQKIELLHRELNHRVKNNLQMLHDLMSLQENSLEEGPVKKMLCENRQRVLTMMLLHRRLYGENNITQVDMKEYLESLLQESLSAYGYEQKITLEKDIEQYYLETDKAIALGLLVNEILNNTFKHAFRDNSDPRLCIRSAKNHKGEVSLLIKDNGPGILANRDGTSFGIQLIETLGKQLNGQLRQNSAQGTQYDLSFRV